jgi:hypothetical protein
MGVPWPDASAELDSVTLIAVASPRQVSQQCLTQRLGLPISVFCFEPSETQVTRLLDPDSSCQGQFID